MNVLVVIPAFIPSVIIGVLRPLAELEKRREIKLRVRLSGVFSGGLDLVDWCDVAVFCRNCEMRDLRVLYALKKKNKKVIYEIDDNFEEIPLTTEVGLYHRNFFRLHVLSRFFSLSDITRVYSARMAANVVRWGGAVRQVKSYFDGSLVSGLSRMKPDGVVRIAYPTGRIDDKALEDQVFGAARKILEAYAGCVEFHLWRATIPRQLQAVPGVVLRKPSHSYERFIRDFFTRGFDIGLAPGVDNPFFHSKTNNKYREFGGCGVAGVYSNFLPYSASVVHGVSGLLVSGGIDEWFKAIDLLIKNTSLRREICKNAKVDVDVNYTFEAAVNSWQECLHSESDKSSLPTRGLPWFPPDNALPLVSFVSIRGVADDDRRRQYAVLACNQFEKANLQAFDDIIEYIKSPHRRICFTTIFITGADLDVSALTEAVAVSQSAIVDLTKCSVNPASIVRAIINGASGVPVTFLVSHDDYESLAQLSTSEVSVVSVRPYCSEIQNAFSLTGYCAAYLNSMEKHLIHAPLYLHKGVVSRAARLNRKIKDVIILWRGRIGILSSLLKWNIGLRRF